MTDSELRKLKRRELLEILLEQAKQIERLEQENDNLKHQLEDRRIHMQNAGTMAEAAFALNGVFEAADAAVSQYIENIRAMAEEAKAKAKSQDGESGDSGTMNNPQMNEEAGIEASTETEATVETEAVGESGDNTK